MKYIIYEMRTGGPRAVVFPEELIHDWVSRGLRADCGRATPISAGFCYFKPVRVEGEAESMNMVSRPEDAEIIAKEYGLE